MDKKIFPSKKKKKYALLFILSIVLVLIATAVYVPTGFSNSVTIDRNKIITAPVEEGLFEDYINLTGQLQPADNYYLGASESGRVERIYVSSGDSVIVGDTLLVLINSELQLSVMQQEAQLLEQFNNQQQTQIILEQREIDQQQQLAESDFQLNLSTKQYNRVKSLFSDSVIAPAEYEPIEAEYNFLFYENKTLKKTYSKSKQMRKSQLSQIKLATDRINSSLQGVRKIIEGLVIKSPVNGILSDFTIKQGETIEKGDEIGQIYNLKNVFITAEIDEFYLGKLNETVSGTATYQNRDYSVTLRKIYPTVVDGKFRIDCIFKNEIPSNMSKGSSIRLKLNLNEAVNSVLVPRGEYYNQTGGEWIFVLKNDVATRIKIRLGRSNPRYYEVLNGLTPGETVIVSSYNGLEKFNTLKFK